MVFICCACDVRINVDDLEQSSTDLCLDAEVITHRSYLYPMAALVVLAEDEPHPFYRNTELQNLLYRIAHDHLWRQVGGVVGSL